MVHCIQHYLNNQDLPGECHFNRKKWIPSPSNIDFPPVECTGDWPYDCDIISLLHQPKTSWRQHVSTGYDFEPYIHILYHVYFAVTWNTYPLLNWHDYGKSPFSMGKSTINGHFQWLFWHNQRVLSVSSFTHNPPSSLQLLETVWRFPIHG